MKPYALILLLFCGCATQRTQLSPRPDPVPLNAGEVLAALPKYEPPADEAETHKLTSAAKASVPVAIVVPSGPTIGLEWNAGRNGRNGASPTVSGIESTEDFAHWFTETNVPVKFEYQQIRVSVPMDAQHKSFRAVDRYQ